MVLDRQQAKNLGKNPAHPKYSFLALETWGSDRYGSDAPFLLDTATPDAAEFGASSVRLVIFCSDLHSGLY